MIARNYCLMSLRNKNIFIPVEDSSPFAVEEEDKTERRDKEKRLNLMEISMEELNEEQKICLMQFYIQKKSYAEIADITHYSIMQVKSHIQNGKRNLKTLVEKKLKYGNGR